jgi:hypothetical protein
MTRRDVDRVVAGAVGVVLVAALLFAVSLSGIMAGAVPDKPAAPGCTPSGVCATTGHRPGPVAASTGAGERHVAQDVTLTNPGPSKLSWVEFHQAIPDGFTFVKDSSGVCSSASDTVTCLHGHVVRGQTVRNTLVYQTPALALGTEEEFSFDGTWCWAGCTAHNPGAARVDSIDLSEHTIVRNVPGFDATYLLAGIAAELATGAEASAEDPLTGTWAVPGQPADLAVTANEVANPPGFPDCPADGLTCRSGDWFAALSPGTQNFKPFSTVTYVQDVTLIPAGTDEDEYQVVYTPCLPGDDPANPKGCPPERLPRCQAATEPRCTEFVKELPDGSFHVGVRIGSHNGYMR